MGLCLLNWFTGQPADTDQGKLQCCTRVSQPVALTKEFALGNMTEFNHETCTSSSESALSS